MIIICRADGTPIEITEDIGNVDTTRFTVGWFTHEIDIMPSSLKLREDIILTLNHVDVNGLSKYYFLSTAPDDVYERGDWVEPKDVEL